MNDKIILIVLACFIALFFWRVVLLAVVSYVIGQYIDKGFGGAFFVCGVVLLIAFWVAKKDKRNKLSK